MVLDAGALQGHLEQYGIVLQVFHDQDCQIAPHGQTYGSPPRLSVGVNNPWRNGGSAFPEWAVSNGEPEGLVFRICPRTQMRASGFFEGLQISQVSLGRRLRSTDKPSECRHPIGRRRVQ